MATKVISGIIWTVDHERGSVTVNFSDMSLSGDIPDTDHYHRCKLQVNAGRPFSSIPAHIIAIHQFQIVESPENDLFRRTTPSEIEHLKINETGYNENMLSFEWESIGGSKIEEISYMVVGEC